MRAVDPGDLTRLHAAMEQRLPRFLADLRTLVEMESGSYTKAGVDRVGDWMAGRLEDLGAGIARHPHAELGDDVVATFESSVDGPTVMLIGHTDTVFDSGYLARRPFERQGDMVLGPGTSDMKSGLLAGLYAVEILRALDEGEAWPPGGRLVYVLNGDEEIGSPVSTPLIAELARSADVAFVLEAGRANGDIVSQRKGMMHLRATVEGRAAHAGVEPQNGRSATLEAAHKTIALHALNGRWPGVTVNVGELRGGTRPNIVAESCVMTIDLRAASAPTQDEAEAAIRQILSSATVAEVRTTVEVLGHTRPMEKTAASAELVEAAVAIAGQLGFSLADAATGGSSDANTTAAAGVPSLDGLGPIGGNDHTPEEYVRVSSIVPRTTLLAALVLAAGSDGRDRQREKVLPQRSQTV